MSRLALCALLACGVAWAQEPEPAARLEALLERDYQAQLRESPTWASAQGDLRYDDQLPDNSAAGVERWLRHTRALQEELAEIPRDALDPARQVDHDLLSYVLAERLRDAPFRAELLPLGSQTGPQIWLPQLPDRLNLATPARRAAFLTRLQRMPAFLRGTRRQLERGVEAGLVASKVAMTGVVEQLDQAARPATEHPLFAPFADLHADDPQRAAAEEAVAAVAAAFAELRDYTRDVYLPACTEAFAATSRPDGEAFYRNELRRHSTLELDADAIHALGLREVARIRAAMFQAIARTDFDAAGREGDALFAAFTDHLRRAPRFYHETPEALLRAYRDVAKQIDAELPRLFRVLPRTPYGVKALPEFVAERAPTAYYYRGSLKAGRAGFFMANTTHLDQRPTYERVALTLHEAVPGHHLQIALAQELTDLHPWRTQLSFSAFTEGWGLYAEKLGLELGEGERGLYQDPYDDFGRLSYEMWRALRLVVDTGLHAKGWSRQRAIDTMLQNSALSQTNVEREVDRYIGWPGQAVAYKLGELELLALRREAEEALGEAFDLRAFHDAVLRGGSLPLPVLRRQVEAWIAAGGE